MGRALAGLMGALRRDLAGWEPEVGEAAGSRWWSCQGPYAEGPEGRARPRCPLAAPRGRSWERDKARLREVRRGQPDAWAREAESLQRCLFGRALAGFLASREAVFLGRVTIVKRTEDILVLGRDGFGFSE